MLSQASPSRTSKRSPAPRGALLLAAAWLMLPLPPATATDDYTDFNELDLSALLDQVVVTASKHEQKISESPVAAYVITAEQIAASGAMGLPELLRDVPGLDVIATTVSHQDVSARGLNEPGSNAILVLVDGRSVYADFYGLTLWEFLPVAMEEIQAIEVILGPGSAFYGANAFACVINILTFGTDELEDTIVRATASTTGGVKGSVVHGNGGDVFGWRLSSTFGRYRNWEEERNEGDVLRLNGKGEWRLGSDDRVTLSTGISDGKVYFVPSTQALDLDGRTGHVSVDYEGRGLKARGFWNTWDLEVIPTNGVEFDGLSRTLAADVFDLEVTHSWRPGEDHLVQWGGEYRRKTVDWMLPKQVHTQNISSVFLYDEWRAAEGFLLSAGVRYDNHPLVGGHMAPRGGLVFKPGDGHTLRASYGVAYRDPTFLESYWYAEVSATPGITQVVRGDLDLESEQIRSLEVGYQGLLRENLLASVTAFRNEVRSIIDMDVVATYPSPPFPFEGIPSEVAFLNDEDWRMIGGEVALEFRVSERLTSRAHWAWVDAEDLNDGDPVHKVPRHIVGASLSGRIGAGHRAVLKGSYKSSNRWTLGSLDAPSGKQSGGDRIVFDASWCWNPDGGPTHLVLNVENLLDERYRDHPLAIEQRRRVRSSLRWGF